MITGVHAIVFAPEPDRVRAFLRDVLGLGWVDAGGELGLYEPRHPSPLSP